MLATCLTNFSFIIMANYILSLFASCRDKFDIHILSFCLHSVSKSL